MNKPRTIHAYKTAAWGEVTLLGVLVLALAAVVESAVFQSGVLALTAALPFVAGAWVYKRYEWEPVVNRVSAGFVAVAVALGVQVVLALTV